METVGRVRIKNPDKDPGFTELSISNNFELKGSIGLGLDVVFTVLRVFVGNVFVLGGLG